MPRSRPPIRLNITAQTGWQIAQVVLCALLVGLVTWLGVAQYHTYQTHIVDGTVTVDSIIGNVTVDSIADPITVSSIESNVTVDFVAGSTVNVAGLFFDQFQRLRVATPFTEISFQQSLDNLPLLLNNAETSGSGTSAVYSRNRASTTLGVSGTTAGTRVLQSKITGAYQPGQVLEVLLTAVVGLGDTGINKRWGYFNANNGAFFEQDDGVLYVVQRSYATGSPVDTRVAQSNWNVDSLDGSGPSGITLDITKDNMYSITLSWLSAGDVLLGINVNRKNIIAHQFSNGNSKNVVYMSNPNLPIRYEISNDGTGNAATLEAIAASIIINGGQRAIGRPVYATRDGVPQTLATQDLYTPIVSVRFQSDMTEATASLSSVDVFVTTTTNYQWIVVLNPTIAGVDAASWMPLTASSLEYDVSRTTANTVSGGYIVAGGYGSSSNQIKSAVDSELQSSLTLGSFIDGTSDELVLAVANIDADGGTAYGSITMREVI